MPPRTRSSSAATPLSAVDAFVARVIATGLGSGYLKPFAGTWGTIPAWLIAWFSLRDNLLLMLVACVAVFVVSVWSAGVAERAFGHDARKIVIDEWAGMLIAVLWLPPTLTWYIAAFVAFRFFDVVKIPPARQLERLPRGWGVTMDDVVAGAQANVVLQLVVYLIAQFR